RIVLASLGAYDRPVPILCNAYAYVPTLNLGMLRRPARDRRSSLAQLTAVLRVPGSPGRIVQAQLFSYLSLLTLQQTQAAPRASTTRARSPSCRRAGRSPATGTAGCAPRGPSTSPTARSSRGSRRRASPST